MTEREYIVATSLARLRIAMSALSDAMTSDEMPFVDEKIRSALVTLEPVEDNLAREVELQRRKYSRAKRSQSTASLSRSDQ